MTEKQRCPLCGREYDGEPALSRVDNNTLICSDCGQRQALHELGISPIDPDFEVMVGYYSHAVNAGERAAE